MSDKYQREVVNYAYLGNHKGVAVTDYGCRILVDTRNRQHLRIITHGVYENAVAWAIKQHLKPTEAFVDVGANIGFFTLLGCKIVGPKGRVIALEPNPDIFDMMDSSVFANSFGKRCIRKNMAAFDSDGELELTWDSAKHGGGRLVTHDNVRIDDNKAIVKLQKIDDILTDNNQPTSVIKIDTEGSEPYVLKGALESLKRSPKCVVIAEWSPQMVKGRGSDIHEYLDFLFSNFKSIEMIEKIGVTKTMDKKTILNIKHGNMILKQ